MKNGKTFLLGSSVLRAAAIALIIFVLFPHSILARRYSVGYMQNEAGDTGVFSAKNFVDYSGGFIYTELQNGLQKYSENMGEDASSSGIVPEDIEAPEVPKEDGLPLEDSTEISSDDPADDPDVDVEVGLDDGESPCVETFLLYSMSTVWYYANVLAQSFVIENAEQLFGLAQLVNSGVQSFEGKEITLAQNIDLENIPWLPIGAPNRPFMGTFDARNARVSNIMLNQDAPMQGFFGFVNGGEIKRLTIENITITTGGTGDSNSATGALVAYAKQSKVIECSAVNVNISANTSYAGGLVGTAEDIEIRDCMASGEVRAVGISGGIIGQLRPKAKGNTIENCVNYCNVSGDYDYLGGIVGGVMFSFAYQNIIKNSVNFGEISGDSYVGGIAGNFCKGTLSESYSSAKISGRIAVGGIAGNIDSALLENCYSVGKVNAVKMAGGLLGNFSNTNIASSYSTAEISAENYAGGIAGYSLDLNNYSEIKNVVYLGAKVSALDGATAGRIIGGEPENTVVFEDCVAWQDVLICDNFVQNGGVNGDGKSFSQFKISENWADSFKAAPWSHSSGSVPVLNNLQVEQLAEFLATVKNRLDNPLAQLLAVNEIVDTEDIKYEAVPKLLIVYEGYTLVYGKDYYIEMPQMPETTSKIKCTVYGIGDFGGSFSDDYMIFVKESEIDDSGTNNGGEGEKSIEAELYAGVPLTGDASGVALFICVFAIVFSVFGLLRCGIGLYFGGKRKPRRLVALLKALQKN